MNKYNFTLVELLVVVSIVAVIGSGIAVTYTGVQEDAKNQITLHEMNQIKHAFKRFHKDNYSFLNQKLYDHDDPDGTPTISDKMDYFATYGIWSLLQKKIIGPPKMEFNDYEPLKGEGWNGPYLDSVKRKVLEPLTGKPGGYDYPQIADKYAESDKQRGYYRVIYVNYNYPSGAPTKTYKRLLLICSRESLDNSNDYLDSNNDGILKNDDIDGDGDFDDTDLEILINTATGAVNLTNSINNDYYVELLNEDS